MRTEERRHRRRRQQELGGRRRGEATGREIGLWFDCLVWSRLQILKRTASLIGPAGGRRGGERGYTWPCPRLHGGVEWSGWPNSPLEVVAPRARWRQPGRQTKPNQPKLLYSVHTTLGSASGFGRGCVFVKLAVRHDESMALIAEAPSLSVRRIHTLC